MFNDSENIKILCDEFKKYNTIAPELYKKYDVKRGLRNADGTGVTAGITQICNVHGYVMDEGEKAPIDGKLVYRGYDVRDIIKGCRNSNRYGYEEVIWLLWFGSLPTTEQMSTLKAMLSQYRELPRGFSEDTLLRAPTNNIMNAMARGVISLYAFDDNPEDTSVENVLEQSIKLISRLPLIAVQAYQVKKSYFDHKSMIFHPINHDYSIAQTILATMRDDMQFTEEEAQLLDTCLILHAEHGGGNNSTFATRVLSSSGTDTYSALAAGIGALKGPRHGGANLKVMEMLHYLQNDVENWHDDKQVEEYLKKLIKKEAGDRSGLIYGIGHAVYTKSDPRAQVLKEQAMKLAEKNDFYDDFLLLDAIERLAPPLIAEAKGIDVRQICANVDLYSGMVYKMLNISEDLFTPLFAVARMAGWCAHRLEEITTGNKIIRPAYKAIEKERPYVDISER